MKYTVMLVMTLVKDMNYKLGVKLIFFMLEFGDDIGYGYVVSFSKCTKYGVGVIVGGNVGWYIGRIVVANVDTEVLAK